MESTYKDHAIIRWKTTDGVRIVELWREYDEWQSCSDPRDPPYKVCNHEIALQHRQMNPFGEASWVDLELTMDTVVNGFYHAKLSYQHASNQHPYSLQFLDPPESETAARLYRFTPWPMAKFDVVVLVEARRFPGGVFWSGRVQTYTTNVGPFEDLTLLELDPKPSRDFAVQWLLQIVTGATPWRSTKGG